MSPVRRGGEAFRRPGGLSPNLHLSSFSGTTIPCGSVSLTTTASGVKEKEDINEVGLGILLAVALAATAIVAAGVTYKPAPAGLPEALAGVRDLERRVLALEADAMACQETIQALVRVENEEALLRRVRAKK